LRASDTAAIGPDYFRETFAVLKAAAGGLRTKPSCWIMRRNDLTPALRS
jgi:hypothetical protein